MIILVFSYSQSVVYEALKRKELRLNQYHKNGTLIGRYEQLGTKTCRLLFGSFGLSGTAKILVLYMFCD